MTSRRGDIPALQSGMPSGLFSQFGSMSSPRVTARRAISYDDNLDAPMQSPPHDMSATMFWKDPVIPQRKFKRIAEKEKEGSILGTQPSSLDSSALARTHVPVVKAKACSLMSTLLIKQTQESLQKFEHQAGLTESGYTPHRGLSAEEPSFHRLADNPLKMPSGDFKEDRLTTSAQSTPCGTPSTTPSVTPCVSPCVTPCVSPHVSPSVIRRSWFNLSPAPLPATPELGSANTNTGNMGGNEGSGGERWSLFGTRPTVQKSTTDPGSETHTGFSLQSYFGLHKSTTMDAITTQANLKVDDPAAFMPPKIEISGIEASKPYLRPHKLKPRDMNVLTPSGF